MNVMEASELGLVEGGLTVLEGCVTGGLIGASILVLGSAATLPAAALGAIAGGAVGCLVGAAAGMIW